MKRKNEKKLRKIISYRTWIAYFSVTLLLAVACLFFIQELTNSYKYFHNYINEDIVVLQPAPSPQCYADSKEYCAAPFVPGTMAFSNADVEKIKTIEGVNSVEGYGNQSIKTENYDGSGVATQTTLSYSLEKEKFESIPALGYLTNSDEWTNMTNVKYEFVNFSYDPESLATYGSYFPTYEGTNLKYGSYVAMDENDIIIPYSLAKVIAKQEKTFVENLIGTTITLPVSSPNSNDKDKEYEIKGIYDDSYGEYTAIYTKYDEKWAASQYPSSSSTNVEWTNEYNSDKQLVQQTQYNDLYKDMFASLANYQKAYKDGIMQIVITIEPGQEEAVMAELASMYPDYFILNSNFIAANYVAPNTKTTVIVVLSTLAFLAGIAALFIIFYRRKIVNSIIEWSKDGFTLEEIRNLIIRKQLGMWIRIFITTLVALFVMRFVFGNIIHFLGTASLLTTVLVAIVASAILPLVMMFYALQKTKIREKNNG